MLPLLVFCGSLSVDVSENLSLLLYCPWAVIFSKRLLKKCQLFRIIELLLIRSEEEGLVLKVYPPSVKFEIAV